LRVVILILNYSADENEDIIVNDEDVFEEDTFRIYSKTLDDVEKFLIREMATTKPIYKQDARIRHLVAKELCPDGWKSIWKIINTNYSLCEPVKFLDLGSGVGQVVLMAQVIGGVQCSGIEIQPHLHKMAVKWHHAIAGYLPYGRETLLDQAKRLYNMDMLSPAGIEQMAASNLIFCNNLLFGDGSTSNVAENLNARLGSALDDVSQKLRGDQTIIVVSTTPIPCNAAKNEKRFMLPKESVSWTTTEIPIYFASLHPPHS